VPHKTEDLVVDTLKHGNWWGPGWSAGKKQSSVYNPRVPCIDKADCLAKKHDHAYALGHDKAKADFEFAKGNLKLGNYLSAAAVGAQGVLRSIGIMERNGPKPTKKEKKIIKKLRKQEKKLLNKPVGPAPPKQGPTHKPGPRPVAHPGVNREISALAKAVEKVARPKNSLTGSPVVHRAFMNFDSKNATLHGKVLVPQSTFLNNNASVAFKAGMVMGLVPLTAVMGLQVPNPFSSNTDYQAKTLSFGRAADLLTGLHARHRIDEFAVFIENSTPPASVNAGGRLYVAYVEDPTLVNDLESGPKLLDVLSQQSMNKGKSQFYTVSMLEPDTAKTRMSIKPAAGYTPGRMLQNSALQSTSYQQDIINRCNGVVLIGCEQDVTVGTGNCTFNVWFEFKVKFAHFLLRDRNPSYRVTNTNTSLLVPATGTYYGNFTNASNQVPLYHKNNPGDIRAAFVLNKNSAVFNASSTYSIDISQLCGPGESITFSILFNNNSNIPTHAFGVYIAAGSTVTGVNNCSASVSGAFIGISLSAVNDGFAIEITPASSPCWVTPAYFGGAVTTTIAMNNPMVVNMTVNATPTKYSGGFVSSVEKLTQMLNEVASIDAIVARKVEEALKQRQTATPKPSKEEPLENGFYDFPNSSEREPEGFSEWLITNKLYSVEGDQRASLLDMYIQTRSGSSGSEKYYKEKPKTINNQK